jgi:hypothetical protein
MVLEFQPEIDMQYLGPLARAQRLDNLASKERYVAFAANASAVFPDAVDIVDIDDVMRGVAIDLSIPASSQRSTQEVTELRETRAAQQQAMQEAAIAQERGKGAQEMAAGEAAQNGDM